jgi:hypothetical protein
MKKEKKILMEVNKMNNESVFGEPVFTYTSEQAIDDGFLAKNFKQDKFPECNIITSNLFEELKQVSLKRSLKKVFEEDVLETLGSLMLYAKDVYDKQKFEDDQDKDFFVVPKGWEMTKNVWFVRNETGKLTAMLPEDY